jgi:flagellar assembly factor FliW
MTMLMNSPVLDRDADRKVVVEMVFPMPGFPDARRFEFAWLEPEVEPFFLLRSLDMPGLEFVVVPPGLVLNDYKVELDEDTTERLELANAGDALVLVLVTLAQPPGSPTANLLGPVVINTSTMQAMQVVLHRSSYSARHRLFG